MANFFVILLYVLLFILLNTFIAFSITFARRNSSKFRLLNESTLEGNATLIENITTTVASIEKLHKQNGSSPVENQFNLRKSQLYAKIGNISGKHSHLSAKNKLFTEVDRKQITINDYIIHRNRMQVTAEFVGYVEPKRSDQSAGTGTTPRLSPIDCYWQQQTISQLPDIDDSPPPRSSIFLLETSCKSASAQRLTISGRAACAVESVARHNPHTNVYLLFTAPAQPDLTNDFLYRQLLAYTNLHLRAANLERLAIGSSFEQFVSAAGELRKSQFAVVHASQIARILLLRKYGGIYLDTDFICLRSFIGLPVNFVAMDAWGSVGNAVLGFSKDGEGHQLIEEYLKNVKANIFGMDWDQIGSVEATQLVQRNCVNFQNCTGNFTVFPELAFYPISRMDFKQIFLKTNFRVFNVKLKNSYAIHVYNGLSSYYKPKEGSPYMLLAEKHCPKIFKVSSRSTFYVPDS